MVPTPDLVLTDRNGGVVTLTINRRDAFNALNRATHEALNAAVKSVAAMHPLPRVLILTGAGEQAFAGGLDPGELVGFGPEMGAYMSAVGQETCKLLGRMPVVTIAAVNGVCVGGGLELNLACDLVIASPNARFVQVEAYAGVVPGFGGTFRLARRVGQMRARLMSYTGRPVDAETGVAWGLALEAVPADRLMDRAREIAGWVLAAAPEAVRETKRVIAESADLAVDPANAIERRAFAARFGTPEMVAAVGHALATREQILAG